MGFIFQRQVKETYYVCNSYRRVFLLSWNTAAMVLYKHVPTCITDQYLARYLTVARQYIRVYYMYRHTLYYDCTMLSINVFTASFVEPGSEIFRNPKNIFFSILLLFDSATSVALPTTASTTTRQRRVRANKPATQITAVYYYYIIIVKRDNVYASFLCLPFRHFIRYEKTC